MDVTSTSDAGSADEATSLGGTFVAKIRTEREAQFHRGLRGRLASRSQTFARRCDDDGHDECPCLGRRAVWSMRSEGQTTYSTVGPDGGQHALHPSGSLPEQAADAADLKAAYRLFGCDDVTFEDILGPHWTQTRQRPPGVYLVLNDTTEVDFGIRRKLRGMGQTGNGGGWGFLLHSALVVGAESEAVFGLAGQRIRYRKPAPKQGELDPTPEARPGIGPVGAGHRSSRPARGRRALGACDGPRSRQLRGVLPLPATAGGLGGTCHAETTRRHRARRTEHGLEAVSANIALPRGVRVAVAGAGGAARTRPQAGARRSRRGRRRWRSVSGG